MSFASMLLIAENTVNFVRAVRGAKVAPVSSHVSWCSIGVSEATATINTPYESPNKGLSNPCKMVALEGSVSQLELKMRARDPKVLKKKFN